MNLQNKIIAGLEASTCNNKSSGICDIEVLKTISKRSAKEVVFSNHLLLKKILTYLVLNMDRKVSQKMIPIIRLVQRSWLQTTTNLLRKSVKPVIVLSLNETNSLDESAEVQKNGKLLDQFVSTFGIRNRLQESLLPFKLNLAMEYFRAENQLSLSDCLIRLGEELIELQVTFPKDGGTMPLIFPRFTLPFLRKLTFQFSHKGMETRPEDQGTTTFGSNRNGLGLLQLFLNASDSITDLNIPWSGISNMNSDTVPLNFEFLQLPISISSLELRSGLKSHNLEVLLRNQLPNLNHLSIKLHFIPPKNDLIFNILLRFQKSLTSLRFEGLVGKVGVPFRTLFTLPLMEKLEQIQIYGSRIELQSQNSENLQIILPKLKRVSLIHYTECLLEKWIQNNKFDHVDELNICYVNDQFGLRHPNYFQSMSLKIINQVHTAFPNVTQLTVTFKIAEMGSLKYVIKNMMKLKSLNILLQGTIPDTDKYYFDSILLGIPVKLVTALTEHSNFVRSVELDSNEQRSIVDLAELTCLTVWLTKIPYLDPPVQIENEDMSCISELLFIEGLLKMPKLKILGLFGKIQASAEMVELWKGHGRILRNGASPRKRK